MSSHAHLLTDSEAAEMLRMIPARVVRLTRAGEIPYVALPDGELRYDPADLWEWACAHKRRSVGEVASS